MYATWIKIAALFLFLFFGVVFTRDMMLKPSAEESLPFFDQVSEENILESLRWYEKYARGALNPTPVFPISLDTYDNEISGFSYKDLLKHGVDVLDHCPTPQSECVGPTINKRYRDSLWWPAGSKPVYILFASTFRYRIDDLEILAEGSGQVGSSLNVRFNWQITELSAFGRDILQSGLPSAETWTSFKAGENISQEVTFVKSKHGYILPLSREPILGNGWRNRIINSAS